MSRNKVIRGSGLGARRSMAEHLTPLHRSLENVNKGRKLEEVTCERCGKKDKMAAGFMYNKRKAADKIKSKYSFLCWDCRRQSHKEISEQKIISANSQDLQAAIKKLRRKGKTKAASLLEKQLIARSKEEYRYEE